MKQEELKTKVINAQNTVAKREAVLQKHRDQLAKLIAKGADKYDISYKESDIEGATRKLEDARKILENWQSKLNERISEDDYLEANSPEILKTFLENWKRNAIAYYIDKYVRFKAYTQDLREKELEARREALRTLPELERCREIYKNREPSEYDLHNLWPRKPVEEFLEKRGLAYEQVQKKIRDFGDGIIFRMRDFQDAAERAEWLEKAMEEERRAKLLDLMTRINKVVGTITDAACLRIGAKGDIEGYVTGTEGRASIETIGAGGYNIQCFHYRTLIHPIK